MNTAIIGLGPHGVRLLQCVNDIPLLSLVAVVDKNSATFEKLPEGSKIKFYSELDELFSNHKLDLVVIATNGPSHHDIAIRTMNEGVRRLFICKPLACSIADAQSIKIAAEKSNTRIVVDHGLRHDTTYRWIRQQVSDNNYGNLKSIYIQRPGIGLGCLGVHSFDLASYLVGETPLTITGWIDEPIGENPRGSQFIDPGGTVLLSYPSGAKATILQTEDGCGPMSVELVFNYARMKVDEKFHELEVVSKDPNFVPSSTNPVLFNREINPHGKEVKHNILTLMKALLTDLISDRTPIADVYHGFSSVEILVGAYQSHDNGHIPVSIPLENPEYINRKFPVT